LHTQEESDELENLFSDEEQEDFEQDKMDMEGNIEDLNKRIDNIAKGFKKAEDLLEERRELRNSLKADLTKVNSTIGMRS
jgi:peptidoglycan hydrolase CwlO-like protein